MIAFDWPTLARAAHVLSVVHWIGGLAVVTTIVLPAARRMAAGGNLVTVRLVSGAAN